LSETAQTQLRQYTGDIQLQIPKLMQKVMLMFHLYMALVQVQKV